MKITDINTNEKITSSIQKSQAVQETQNAGREKEAASSQPQAMDKVDISSMSRDVQKVQEVLKNTPDVRAEKVQELKAKVESGQYKVDAREIAGKMISSFIQDLS